MDVIYDKKFFVDYIKKLKDNEVNQIYNMKTPKDIKPYIMQFKQLLSYFNYSRKLEKALLLEGIKMENYYSCYLIDKNWFQRWKIHVGYDEIKNEYKKYNKDNDLNDNDYGWIEPIISKNSKNNLLTPLNNNNIFFQNEIKYLDEYIIVDKETYNLFNLGIRKSIKSDHETDFPVKIFKGKLFLYLNRKKTIFEIVFIEKISNKYFELLIKFEKEDPKI